MIAEGGLAALWLAAALSLLQLLIGAAAVGSAGALAAVAGDGVARTPAESLDRFVRSVAVAQGVLASIAFLALIWLFLRTDLSVQLVAANSHSAKPWLYKFAGAWGNHEGSMLLWVTVMSAGSMLAASSATPIA